MFINPIGTFFNHFKPYHDSFWIGKQSEYAGMLPIILNNLRIFLTIPNSRQILCSGFDCKPILNLSYHSKNHLIHLTIIFNLCLHMHRNPIHFESILKVHKLW